MRTGNNPMKGQQAPAHLPKQVATVITHLPNLSGYHAHRLEVVTACLLSMRKFSGVPVMVWDNGSCGQLKSWLLDTYKPDYLILSPNIGKWSARLALARMMPVNRIVGFADDDILFFPGWWEESKRILETYPSVGAVSAWPVRVSSTWGITNTVAWAKENAAVEVGRFIPDSEERDYAVSVGSDPASHAARKDLRDTRITYQGVQAYASAQHCQFMSYAGVIAPFCSENTQAMYGEKDFDDSIDNAGLLRLTTIQRHALHMGNVIHPDLKATIEELKLG